jgi:hypothetical protein
MAKRKNRQTRDQDRHYRGKLGEKILTEGTMKWMPGDLPSPSHGKSPALDFTDALMRGNPKAERILREATGIGADEPLDINVDRQEEASLADKFVAATYDLPRRWKMNGRERKKVEPILQSYRVDMRKAHRFVLDDEFCRYATEISTTTPPERLLTRIQYATLPFDTTWVEFDLKTKVRTMRALHGMDDSRFDYAEVANRMGLLMKRLSDTEVLVELAVESIGDSELYLGTTICYLFSTSGEHEWTATDGNRFGCQALPIQDPYHTPYKEEQADEWLAQVGAASLWSYIVKGKSGMLERASDIRKLRLPSLLLKHGVLGFGRMYSVANSLNRYQTQEGFKAIADLVGHEVGEFAGMCRWVVILLAMLNEVPVDKRLIQPSGKVRYRLNHSRPLTDYHRLTLRLPKLDPVKYIEKQLRTAGARRRQHPVRSHWRHYLEPEHCKPEEHAWEWDHEEGYALCGKCMSYMRRIPDHLRGDPSLGFVQHDYVLKKDPRAEGSERK